MNSSVKSLVPIVTGGLPLPGWAGAAADVLLPDDVAVEPPWLSSLPHAATANAIVAASSDQAINLLMVPRIAVPPPPRLLRTFDRRCEQLHRPLLVTQCPGRQHALD